MNDSKTNQLPPFAHRHIGPDAAQAARMLEFLGCPDLDTLIDAIVPEAIRRREPLNLPAALDEPAALQAVSYTHLTLPTN